MTGWSLNLQPSISHSNSEATEPNFAEYASYCLTSYDDNYENVGPYGDPLSIHQEGFFQNLYFSGYGEEVEYDGLTNEKMPCGGGDDHNWLGDYKSYIVGWWEDDAFSNRYTPCGDGGLQKGEEQFDGYYSYDNEMEIRPFYDNNYGFFGYGFGLGSCVGEDQSGYGEVEPSYGESSDELRLCESIFGHWS